MPLVYITSYKRGWLGDPKTFGYMTTDALFPAETNSGRLFSTSLYSAPSTIANWSVDFPEYVSIYNLYAQTTFGGTIGYIGATGGLSPTIDYRNESILGILSGNNSFLFWITGDLDTPSTYIERIHINNITFNRSTATYDPQHGEGEIQFGPAWTWGSSANLVTNTNYEVRVYWRV